MMKIKQARGGGFFILWLLVLGWGPLLWAAGEVHTFVYKPEANGPQPEQVHVAGTFNGWSTTATPMQRREDGSWVAEVTLGSGIYQYKFVVVRPEWQTDREH